MGSAGDRGGAYREPAPAPEEPQAVDPLHEWKYARGLEELNGLCLGWTVPAVLVTLAAAGSLVAGLLDDRSFVWLGLGLFGVGGALAAWVWYLREAMRQGPSVVDGVMRLGPLGWSILANGRRYSLQPPQQRHTFQQPGRVRAWVLPALSTALSWHSTDDVSSGQQGLLDERFGVEAADRDTMHAGLIPARISARLARESALLIAAGFVMLSMLAVTAVVSWAAFLIALPFAGPCVAFSEQRLRENRRTSVAMGTGVISSVLGTPHFTPDRTLGTFPITAFRGPEERIEAGAAVRAFFLRDTSRILALELLSPAERDTTTRTTSPEIEASLSAFRACFHSATSPSPSP